MRITNAFFFQNGSGYIFILAYEVNVFNHPVNRELIGQNSPLKDSWE